VRPRFDIVRVVGGVVRPPELNGTHGRLLVQQKGEVDIDAGHCLTVTYAYRYRATEQPDSWIFRWEFLRSRPRRDYPYPLAHFDVNGRLADGRNLAAEAPGTDTS
jgi:hypothetical protein